MLKHPPKADKIHTKHRKHSRIPGLSYSCFSTSLEWARFAKIQRKIPGNWDQSESSSCFFTWERPGWSFPKNPVGILGFFLGKQHQFPEPTATRALERGGKKFPGPFPALPTFPAGAGSKLQEFLRNGIRIPQGISSVHCLPPQFRKIQPGFHNSHLDS